MYCYIMLHLTILLMNTEGDSTLLIFKFFFFLNSFNRMSINSPTVARPLLGQELSYGGQQKRLYNSMIDVALVYGIDESTYRSLDMQEKGVSKKT